MKDLIKSKEFIKGFIGGTIALVFFNTFIFFDSKCHHCVNRAGFPMVFWEKFTGTIFYTPESGFSSDDFEHFFGYNLIADILITIVFSFIAGLIFKFIRQKLQSQNLGEKEATLR